MKFRSTLQVSETVTMLFVKDSYHGFLLGDLRELLSKCESWADEAETRASFDREGKVVGIVIGPGR